MYYYLWLVDRSAVAYVMIVINNTSIKYTKHTQTSLYVHIYMCIYSVDGDLVACIDQSCIDCCSFPCRCFYRCFYIKIFKFKKQFYWNGNRIDRNISNSFSFPKVWKFLYYNSSIFILIRCVRFTSKWKYTLKTLNIPYCVITQM